MRPLYSLNILAQRIWKSHGNAVPKGIRLSLLVESKHPQANLLLLGLNGFVVDSVPKQRVKPYWRYRFKIHYVFETVQPLSQWARRGGGIEMKRILDPENEKRKTYLLLINGEKLPSPQLFFVKELTRSEFHSLRLLRSKEKHRDQ